LIKRARDARIRNPMVGTANLLTHAFHSILARIPEQPQSGKYTTAKYTDGLTVTAPLLFDTASELAQNFQGRYRERYGVSPDWVAAYGYEATHQVVRALRNVIGDGNRGIADIRRGIRDDWLKGEADRNTPAQDKFGVTGETFFDAQGIAKKPIQIGQYDGQDVVSAPTQLRPLTQRGSTNYIAELKKGRMLYVNDRFMFKTNVVYTGIELHRVDDVNSVDNSVQLDFSIWFRYRGRKFSPADVTFLNASEPIVFSEPERSEKEGDMTFELYRIKERFRMDFSNTAAPYGSHIVGLAFRHKNLNRNNLLYVMDVLGMRLASGDGTLRDRIESSQALDSVPEWVMERAWLAQEVIRSTRQGRPEYVGYSGMEPDFSRIELGVMVREGGFNIREWLPDALLVYSGIFAFIGILFAFGIDTNTQGKFWRSTSWALRVFFWPLFLISAGNVLLDWAILSLPVHYVDSLVRVYHILWWLMPARLVTMAMERFIWLPLEARTERKIPNVIRMFARSVIYLFAIFGIIAFVYDQKLTSLLATGGLLTMIIGLAVQSNIANVFSGIVVNIERPFKVGDWVGVGDREPSKVIDITWRTVRLQTMAGEVISIPNAKASEATIINHTTSDRVRGSVDIHASPSYAPQEIIQRLNRVLDSIDGLAKLNPPRVIYQGITNLWGTWSAQYRILFWVREFDTQGGFKELINKRVWQVLQRDSVTFMADGMTVDPAYRINDEWDDESGRKDDDDDDDDDEEKDGG
ncbi:MAG: mechanosensitive ion channel, partial [Gammaproteobacteria bacterium]|nr:mechanosensitive ion channel [Gammaproteobacteria bacterium]